MMRRTPSSTRSDTLFRTRLASDLLARYRHEGGGRRRAQLALGELAVVTESFVRQARRARQQRRLRPSDAGDGKSVEVGDVVRHVLRWRSEEHTSELQSLMRISYAVFCLKKKSNRNHPPPPPTLTKPTTHTNPQPSP